MIILSGNKVTIGYCVTKYYKDNIFVVVTCSYVVVVLPL
jgi:hypothetical protein